MHRGKCVSEYEEYKHFYMIFIVEFGRYEGKIVAQVKYNIQVVDKMDA